MKNTSDWISWFLTLVSSCKLAFSSCFTQLFSYKLTWFDFPGTSSKFAFSCSCTHLFSYQLTHLIYWRLKVYFFYSYYFLQQRQLIWNVLPLCRSVFTEAVIRRCSVKKGVLRNFAKFTGKHLCQSLFFNKVAGLRRSESWLLVIISNKHGMYELPH